MEEKYPPELSVEDIKIKIQQTSGNPNIGKTHQVVLKDGPRTYRIVTLFEILDPSKEKLHHLSLQVDSFDKTKAGWRAKPDKRIRLEGEEPDEIQVLSKFLNAVLSEHYPARSGEYHVIPEQQFELLSNLTELIPKLPGSRKLELVIEVIRSLDQFDVKPEQFVNAFLESTPEAVKNIGLAARFVQYQTDFAEFVRLVENSDSGENKFQQHLQRHPWIFGSEYSELLDRRTWTRDDNLDFMLRRTVDGYLEIIEIKTPSVGDLFRYDANHDSYYPASKLSQAIGQVFRYIEEVERKRDSIIANDKLDPLKIRARIIIGRDGGEDQRAPLRTLNSHLHRVEILTFDQLVRVGKRTLNIFQSEISGEPVASEEIEEDEDVPF